MSLEASTTNPMYTTELYKSVTVNDNLSSVIEDAAPHQNSEVGDVGEVGSGTDAVELEEDWSKKWISLENSL